MPRDAPLARFVQARLKHCVYLVRIAYGTKLPVFVHLIPIFSVPNRIDDSLALGGGLPILLVSIALSQVLEFLRKRDVN